SVLSSESPLVKSSERSRKSGLVQIWVGVGLSKSRVLAGDKSTSMQIIYVQIDTNQVEKLSQ
ncbi:MAG: hypothetical protein VW907_06015, partial [Opitutae bacterium]